MHDNRWMINRAGLVNFWYYDEEEFAFSQGRLLLRGANGSGKSVTMQSFIPLLLDGNKSPERLDPFGSRARKLENYLLGEDEDGKEESVGYLYMEFMKEKSGNFLTIGMGLRAVRGKSLDFWGFAITDGRRVGRDFFLYKDLGEKVPLSQKELKHRIGAGGLVVHTASEYMKMVNDLLFGYPELDNYDELIKLLIQIRTPKLSKGFKPTLIYEIMNNSLQPLSDEDLRPMSEAIEHMDGIKARLEVLQVSKKAARHLKESYHRYNQFMLQEKAAKFLQFFEELKRMEQEKEDLTGEIAACQKEFTEAEEQIALLHMEQRILEEKKSRLEVHDSFQIKSEINKLEANIGESIGQKEKKEEAVARKKGETERLAAEEVREREQEAAYLGKIREQLTEMDQKADAVAFHEQSFFKDEILADLKKEYSFAFVQHQVQAYEEKLLQATKALEEESRQNEVYDKALAELDRTKALLQEKKAELDRGKMLFEEIKEEFIEKVYTWEKNNQELKISGDNLVKIIRLVTKYGQDVCFDDLTGEVRENFHRQESHLHRELSGLKVAKEQKEGELAEKMAELKEWEGKKDPEPVRDSRIKRNRERLDREKIPYLPFYMAVDFKDGLGEAEKGKIEEALMDLGLLDALIIPEAYKKQVFDMDREMADKYLFPAPKLFSYNLSTVLTADKTGIPEITPGYVAEVLDSILLEEKEDALFLQTQGEYGFGILKGKVSGNRLPKLIGAAARKRFKEEMVREIRDACREIEEAMALVENRISGISRRLDLLNREFHLFPEKKDLNTAMDQVNILQLDFTSCAREAARRGEEERKAFDLLQQARAKVHERTSSLELAPQLPVYREAERTFREYRNLLTVLETEHVKLLSTVRSLHSLGERKADTEKDLAEFMLELTDLARGIREKETLLRHLQENLQLTNYEEIARELDACLKGLREIPGKIIGETKRETAYRQKHQTKCLALEELEKRISRYRMLTEVYGTGFQKEAALGYGGEAKANLPVYQAAQEMIREIGWEEPGKGRDYFTNALMEKFHEQKKELTEYNLRIEYIFDQDPGNGESEEWKDAVLFQRRLEIKGKIRGKQVNFFELTALLEEAIEENEKLLKENERQLFEEILAKNISKKIRAKIRHSEQWVYKMNELMESMNTSSGLSFSLSWKSKRAEEEDQLDTAELVRLLKYDGGLLRTEELDKLAGHFQSKIKEAKRLCEETGKPQTFHSMMKEVLDYRQWFEFQLFFRKTRENKKELTNHAFDKFSGGEKAMAMYVPLFTAVYARYEGARKDCPRIISLDEAFAGVDENNIRDMFRLLNEFDLNYVINSQILWGDYDTVPSLSICELVRPNNADYVTVIRYRWNGRVKELVLGQEVAYGT